MGSRAAGGDASPQLLFVSQTLLIDLTSQKWTELAIIRYTNRNRPHTLRIIAQRVPPYQGGRLESASV